MWLVVIDIYEHGKVINKRVAIKIETLLLLLICMLVYI